MCIVARRNQSRKAVFKLKGILRDVQSANNVDLTSRAEYIFKKPTNSNSDVCNRLYSVK